MAVTERHVRRLLPEVDVVWEVADARCPVASRNARLVRLCGGKPRVLVLSKSDLAEADVTAAWQERLRIDQPVVVLDLRGARATDVGPLWRGSRQALERAGRRARSGPIRALVAGIPNVGKSTLLNRVSGGRHLAVGAQPGVTRGPQWLHTEGDGMVCDLPGVLPARVGQWPVAWRLWCIGAVGPEAVDEELAAEDLVRFSLGRRCVALRDRYGVPMDVAPEEVLRWIAGRRGLVQSGGVPDTRAAAQWIAAEFRRGLLGRLSLELPEDVVPGG